MHHHILVIHSDRRCFGCPNSTQKRAPDMSHLACAKKLCPDLVTSEQRRLYRGSPDPFNLGHNLGQIDFWHSDHRRHNWIDPRASNSLIMPTRLHKSRKKRGHASAGHGRIGKRRSILVVVEMLAGNITIASISTSIIPVTLVRWE